MCIFIEYPIKSNCTDFTYLGKSNPKIWPIKSQNTIWTTIIVWQVQFTHIFVKKLTNWRKNHNPATCKGVLKQVVFRIPKVTCNPKYN